MLATIVEGSVAAPGVNVMGHFVKIHATDKALAIAKEFREALIPFNREIRLLIEKKEQKGYLPQSEFTRKWQLERIRNMARKAKTHSSRMKLLAEFKGA
jgi:hypothetical protein